MAHDVPPRGGWLRAIRKALGMSTARSSRAVSASRRRRSRISSVMRRRARSRCEACGASRRRSTAASIYAVVPKKPLAQMRRARALELADRLVRPVAHSMKLEAQGVSAKETAAPAQGTRRRNSARGRARRRAGAESRLSRRRHAAHRRRTQGLIPAHITTRGELDAWEAPHVRGRTIAGTAARECPLAGTAASAHV